ncbi:hypothetical protein C2L65_27450 [Paraburkholderia terrae]|uniref:Transmembrane protein n=1 Tax=Paraburkholderia terrae TaxID=311230 RepID=A0A2I8EV10_9BURK|nr:hypothetical protein C2L65_27450 [Paraburkholderia terrae]
MKRLSVAVLGFVWGLMLTWFLLYAFSHIDWTHTNASASGCSDMEHCSPRVHTVFVLASVLLGPGIVFATLNATAYRRWTMGRWTSAFCIGTVLVVLFYVAPYAVPRFGVF